MTDEGLQNQRKQDASEATSDKCYAAGETAALVEPMSYGAICWVNEKRRADAGQDGECQDDLIVLCLSISNDLSFAVIGLYGTVYKNPTHLCTR